jgi:glutamate formiminotransferase/formiminotetrahydrofolate cyclodeaminase
MDSFWNLPLSTVLERIASNNPVPGGGSASSMSGLIGLSLVLMSINITKQSSIHEKFILLKDTADSLERNIDKLKALAEDDMKAFSEYMEALRLPKGRPELDSIRQHNLKQATKQAINIPIYASQILVESLKNTIEIVPYIKKSVVSDAFAGCELMKSSAIAILLNVDVNLKSKLISNEAEYFYDIKNNILKDIEEHFKYISDIAKTDGYKFNN